MPLHKIKQGLYDGHFHFEDRICLSGTTRWKPLGEVLQREKRFAVYFFGAYAIACIVGGLWLTWFGLGLIEKARVTESWPSVIGYITYSQVENSGGARNQYLPVVSYTYQVGSKQRFGSTIAIIELPGSERKARQVVERYPVGGACRVYYSLQNPGVALLEPGLGPHPYWLVGCCLLLIDFGLLFAFFSEIARRERIDKRPSRSLALTMVICTATVVVGGSLILWFH